MLKCAKQRQQEKKKCDPVTATRVLAFSLPCRLLTTVMNCLCGIRTEKKDLFKYSSARSPKKSLLPFQLSHRSSTNKLNMQKNLNARRGESPRLCLQSARHWKHFNDKTFSSANAGEPTKQGGGEEEAGDFMGNIMGNGAHRDTLLVFT